MSLFLCAKAVVAGEPTSEVSPQAQECFYTSEEYGFDVKGPTGWVKRQMGGAYKGQPEVIFLLNESGGKTEFPLLAINVDMAPYNIKTALDFSKYILPGYEASAKKNGANFKMIEPIHEIEVNGIKGSKFIFEMSDATSKGMKSADYKFMKNNIVVSLQGMDSPELFDRHLKDFEEAAKSFRFLDKMTRKFGIERLFIEGKNSGQAYTGRAPDFSLRIPEETKRKWYFLTLDKQATPFYIFDETSKENKGVPFISFMVEPLPQNELATPKAQLFEKITSGHEAWERDNFGGKVNFVKKGPVNVNGLEAFERVFEAPEIGMGYHIIYIITDNFLMQLGLNTHISDFAQDDSDFIRIVNTLNTKGE